MNKIVLYAAFSYLVFVIYGSLVPLEFVGITMAEAFFQFQNIRYLDLGIGSRADWVANILLFIPLAFLWMGWLSIDNPDRSLGYRVFNSCCVIFACIFLCVSIEFTQLFFPQRTVSINDIVAESLGAIIGVSGWWVWGGKATKSLKAWTLEQSSTKKIDYYLQFYVAGIFFYSIMPLDLTISLVEIYHKWNEGRVILIPFSVMSDSAVENMYSWVTEIALWIPVPILWQRKTPEKDFTSLLFKVFIVVFTIEFFQLFVFSRVTDSTDIVLGLAGGSIGIWLSLESNSGIERQKIILNLSTVKTLVAGATAYLLWFFLLMLVFWYPFDFEFNADIVKERIMGFFGVPFYAYYFGSEFRAITEIFHKTLLFMPLGAFLAFMLKNYRNHFLYFWLALAAITSSAIWIEMGQVFLSEKIVSSTDVVLYVMGGILGLRVGGHFFSIQVAGNSSFASLVGTVVSEPLKKNVRNDQQDNLAFNSILSNMCRNWIPTIVLVCILAVGLFFSGESSLLPYNVRELIAGDYAFFRCVGMSMSLFWCLGFPVWFLSNAIKKKMNAFLCFIYGVGIHSFFSWVLIRTAAPVESIHDIVGYPVLDIPAEIEMFLRFFSLFSVLSFALFGGVLSTIAITRVEKKTGIYFAMGLIAVIVMLPIHHWVIIIAAATDNLTELMVEEGYSFAIIGIFLYFFVFGFAGSMVSAAIALYRTLNFLWAIGVVLISFPLGYMLLNWGTEAVIYKYGQVFSALQFLLSPDREHFLAENELFISFCWANFILLMLVCFAQFLLFFRIANDYE